MINNLYFENDDVMVLDQSFLPEQVRYEKCQSPEQLASAIRTLKVRGAPLIGVTAAYGLAMAVARYSASGQELESYFMQVKELFASTRPTAVNLFWALERMERVFCQNASLPPEELGKCLKDEAEKMYEEDVRINEAIGEFGQELLNSNANVMTICNAGALATCGYGTALGIIRSAARRNKIARVWACETRPVLQGSRLTVFELIQDNIPVTLITDNMAGYTMGLGEIDAIVVGADRIAANGDTANKIGTYSLAVLAQYHDIPFYVAAPLSTFDINIARGRDIPIEERNHEEVRKIQGICLTVPEVDVFNPAFDVTPYQLINGIVCEKGIIRPPYSSQLEALLKEGDN